MVLGQLDSYMQRSKAGIPTSHHIQKLSRWIKNLNVKAKPIKLLGENIDIKLSDLRLGNGFSDISKIQATKIDKLGIKNKKLCLKRHLSRK